ncbi:hypothetical protein HDU76_012703 [Blyttiomyces sp. JEL0837]|nr:hypothetical protein HDU76_012703 [Blyttiomyces sp. JEL0837]
MEAPGRYAVEVDMGSELVDSYYGYDLPEWALGDIVIVVERLAAIVGVETDDDVVEYLLTEIADR